MRRLAPLAAILAALAIGACGSDDDDGGSGGDDTTAKKKSGATFRASDVGFTFTHPPDLRQDDTNEGKVLATLVLDKENRLAIRKTSEQEVKPGFYLDEFERDFERSPQIGDVEKRTEEHSGQEMGVLVIPDAPSAVAGSNERVRAEEYFFAGGGKTWQIECLSTANKRAAISAACKQALESIEFR